MFKIFELEFHDKEKEEISKKKKGSTYENC